MTRYKTRPKSSKVKKLCLIISIKLTYFKNVYGGYNTYDKYPDPDPPSKEDTSVEYHKTSKEETTMESHKNSKEDTSVESHKNSKEDTSMESHKTSTEDTSVPKPYRDQDRTVVKNLYKQMKGWNGRLKTDPKLEKLAQALGCIRTHADHLGSRQDKEAQTLSNNLAYIIACVGGCPARGGGNWSRSKPAQIWYEFRHKTGHYKAILKNNRMGCSAKKSGNKICTFCYLSTEYN